MTRPVLACLLLALAMLATPAHADDNRPLTVTITAEQDAGQFRVQWKVPPNIDRAFIPALVPPESCEVGERQRNWPDALGHWREEFWQCEAGLAGQEIAIAYPIANPGLATIARVHGEGASPQTILLQPGENLLAIPLPAAEGEDGTFGEFLRLGFEHIWQGIDHLLFVTGLIVVARTWRRILVTVTGFTIAHSLTLGLAALDVIRLSTRAVEAVIALSIVFLAVEIAKGPRDTLTWRRPVAVAASFGLLHGFGFASVLREVGLPDEGVLSALLAFNVGIEIGQVIFAGLVFAALQLALKLTLRTRDVPSEGRLPFQHFAAYFLGITASYWMIERLLSA